MQNSNKNMVILKIVAAFFGIVTISFVTSLNNSSLLAIAQEQSQTSGNQSGPILRPETKPGGDELPETFREAMNNSGFTNTGNDTGTASNEITVQDQANGTQPLQNNGTQPTNDNNPCSIIDMRLARGEITIEEYERLHQILQC